MKRDGLTTIEQIENMQYELENSRSISKVATSALSSLTKFIINFVFFAFVLILIGILVNIYMAKQNGQTPNVFGYYMFSIESASMDPTLPVGSIILSKKTSNASELKERTIVTFKNKSGSRVTHRIIEIITDEKGGISYKTKGDNPINSPDKDLLLPSDIEAIFVIKLPLF